MHPLTQVTAPRPIWTMAPGSLLVLVLLAAPAACQNPSYTIHLAAGVQLHVIAARLGPSVHIAVTTARGSGSAYPTETFGSMVRRTQPLAAITGSAFCTRTFRPIGDIVVGGKVVNRGHMGTVLCVRQDGSPSIRRVPFGRRQDWRGYETVLGCGPTLVRQGKVDIDEQGERFQDPRMLGVARHCACGLGPEGRFFLVTTSSAVSLPRLAQAMVEIGCDDAMLLDGGGSTGMYYRGSFITSTPRPLANILAIHATQPPLPSAGPAMVAQSQPPVLAPIGAPSASTPVAPAQSAAGLCEQAAQLKRQKRLSEAAERYAAAISADPACRDAHWGLAWVLSETGCREQAVAEFRQVLQLAPTPTQRVESEAALRRLGPLAPADQRQP